MPVLPLARSGTNVDLRRYRGGLDRQGGTVECDRGRDARFERGDEARFSGEVWIRSGPVAPDGTNVGVVHFSPGARTRWHMHPGGQFLYGVNGRGRVRSKGQAGTLLQPGDVAYVPPGEWHFHGGEPDSPLVHVAVNGGGAPRWGQPVTDEEYAEGL
jgi:quercetin dioxygenase-like cupin family protein